MKRNGGSAGISLPKPLIKTWNVEEIFESNILLGFETRQALQIFYQNIDCSERCGIKTFNQVEAPRIDDLIIYSR